MGISPAFGEISKGLVGRVESLFLAFQAFHSPVISTALVRVVLVFAAAGGNPRYWPGSGLRFRFLRIDSPLSSMR